MSYANPEEGRRKGRELKVRRRAELRAEMIEAYGGQCACCGESWSPFLTIDHVHDDGNTRHVEVGSRVAPDGSIRGGKGHHLYKWLKDHGWPKSDFQLLCWNCNSAKGNCPPSHMGALGIDDFRRLIA